MKTLRIILIVIVIGCVVFVTKKLWAPTVPQQVMQLTDGRQCYTYSHEADSTAPYTVQEFLDITIKGTTVTGTKKGTQAGPDMTNGYTGSFLGTLDNNKITGIFSYTIEGSKNKEQEIYQANTTGLEKLRYPLIEKNCIQE